SFIPPGPLHPRAALAVGCESGVWFYRLDDGKATRLYSGHNGPVYCLAPSADGRWLATGSSDQTVRLWTLAGCDELAGLGAEFERLPDGTRRVRSVASSGFAEAMGLRVGDVPVLYGLEGRIATEAEFFDRYGTAPPGTPINLRVKRIVGPADDPNGVR